MDKCQNALLGDLYKQARAVSAASTALAVLSAAVLVAVLVAVAATMFFAVLVAIGWETLLVPLL